MPLNYHVNIQAYACVVPLVSHLKTAKKGALKFGTPILRVVLRWFGWVFAFRSPLLVEDRPARTSTPIERRLEMFPG